MSGRDNPANINVGGTMYTVSPSTILNYPGTMLGSMLSERWNAGKCNDPIFLDRDPVRFRYILDFYRNGKIVIPCTITKAEMFAEVEYFALPLEKENIQYDIESIAEIKRGFSDFDDMLVAKLKKTAYEDAVVASASELAALMIEKLRKSPGQPSIYISHSEIPKDSFVEKIYNNVIHEATFKDRIQGIVQQGGYEFIPNINNGYYNDEIGLARVGIQ